MNWRAARGYVVVRVEAEEVEIGGVRLAYGKEVTPNGVVVSVGSGDAMGDPEVSVGDRVYVPSGGADQFEEGGVRYAVVHHGRIRLIWKA